LLETSLVVEVFSYGFDIHARQSRIQPALGTSDCWRDVMNWTDIRASYPNQWLLVEALRARSQDDKRVVDDLGVVDAFADSSAALKQYSRLHHQAPDRELYVFHTSRDQLDITERQWLGVRIAG
jgi:hypothetical protein